MNKSKKNNKAEDLLINDPLLKKLKSGDSLNALVENKEEIRVATQILDVISSKSEQLSDNDKSELKQRIKKSFKTYKLRRLYYSVSAAAAIIIVLISLSVLYIQSNSISEIAYYAKNTQQNYSTNNTRLILGTKELLIETKNSEIKYTGNGENIKIGENKEVEQKVNLKDVVYNTVIVPFGKRSQITLTDNSIVWLNSGSKLVYPATFSDKKREVYLEGEAIFDVSHDEDKPFYVISHDIEIKVLGTVFNVTAYNDDKFTNTVLESGSVELKYKSESFFKQSKLTITPGTLAKYNSSDKSINQTKVNTKLYTSWRNGELFFENESLENITKKISRYYNVKITISNRQLSKETFSGRLDLKKSATEILEIIGATTDFNISESENNIIIN